MLSKDSLVPVFSGCDAVVSCLGARSWWPPSPVTLYSDTIVPITAAMRSAKVKKLVVMSSAACKGDVIDGIDYSKIVTY